MVSRRKYLAALSTLPLAGCSESPSSSPSPDYEPAPSDTISSPDNEPDPPENISSKWPMPAYDAGRSNFTPESAGPKEQVTELWSVSMDDSLSGPILVDETIYVGSRGGTVRAVDARTGTERWHESVGAPAGTPRAIDDRLYVPTTEAIVTLGVSDGASGWRIETPDRNGVLVSSHGVYFLSAGDSPTVVALNLADGSEQWRTDINDPWTSTMFASDEQVFLSTGSQWEEPWILAADTGAYNGNTRPVSGGSDFVNEQIFLDGTVFATDALFGEIEANTIDRSYSTRWSTTINAYNGFALSGGADSIYFHAEDGDEPGLYSLSQTEGSQEWVKREIKSIIGRPVVSEDIVVVHTDEALRGLDPGDGSDLWTYPGGQVGSQFVIVDNLLFTVVDKTIRALCSCG